MSLIFIFLIISCTKKEMINYDNFNFSDEERLELVDQSDNLIIIHFHKSGYPIKNSYLNFKKDNQSHLVFKKYKEIIVDFEGNKDWHKMYRNAMFLMKKTPNNKNYLTVVATPALRPLYVSDYWNDAGLLILEKIALMWEHRREDVEKQSLEFTDTLIKYPKAAIKKYELNDSYFFTYIAKILQDKNVKTWGINELKFLINFSFLSKDEKLVKLLRKKLMDNYSYVSKNLSPKERIEFFFLMSKRFKDEKFKKIYEESKIVYQYKRGDSKSSLMNQVLFLEFLLLKDEIDHLVLKNEIMLTLGTYYYGNQLYQDKDRKIKSSLNETVKLMEILIKSHQITLDKDLEVKIMFLGDYLDREFWRYHYFYYRSDLWQPISYFQDDLLIRAFKVNTVSCQLKKDFKCLNKLKEANKILLSRLNSNHSLEPLILDYLYTYFNNLILIKHKFDNKELLTLKKFFVPYNILSNNKKENNSEICSLKEKKYTCEKKDFSNKKDLLREVFSHKGIVWKNKKK